MAAGVGVGVVVGVFVGVVLLGLLLGDEDDALSSVHGGRLHGREVENSLLVPQPQFLSVVCDTVLCFFLTSNLLSLVVSERVNIGGDSGIGEGRCTNSRCEILCHKRGVTTSSSSENADCLRLCRFVESILLEHFNGVGEGGVVRTVLLLVMLSVAKTS